MSNGRNTRARLTAAGLLAACALLLAAAAGAARGQGQYEEVTDADVVAMRLFQHFSPDGKFAEPQFEWSFKKDGKFVVKKGKGPIPAHLLKKLLKPASGGKAPAVDEVAGKWKLKDGQLVLTDIRAGDAAGHDKADFHIYRTAPTVIRLDERLEDDPKKKAQYVFEIGS